MHFLNTPAFGYLNLRQSFIRIINPETFSLPLQTCKHSTWWNRSLRKERSEEIPMARRSVVSQVQCHLSRGCHSRGGVLSVGRGREGTTGSWATDSTPRIGHGNMDSLPAYSFVKRQLVFCVSSPECTCYLCSSPRHPGFNRTPRLHKPQHSLIQREYPCATVLEHTLSENTASSNMWGWIKTKILNQKQKKPKTNKTCYSSLPRNSK